MMGEVELRREQQSRATQRVVAEERKLRLDRPLWVRYLSCRASFNGIVLSGNDKAAARQDYAGLASAKNPLQLREQ